MTDIQVEPPEESEQESSFGTAVLRFVVVLLCVFIGFALVILGYAAALFLDLTLEEFNTHMLTYFSISLIIWILIGLFVPKEYVQKFFEAFKDLSAVRVIAIILIVGTFVILHWYILTAITQGAIAVFAGE